MICGRAYGDAMRDRSLVQWARGLHNPGATIRNFLKFVDAGGVMHTGQAELVINHADGVFVSTFNPPHTEPSRRTSTGPAPLCLSDPGRVIRMLYGAQH